MNSTLACYFATVVTPYGEVIEGYIIAHNAVEAVDILVDDNDLDDEDVELEYAELA